MWLHTSTQTARSLSSMDNPTSDGQWGPRRLAVPAGSGRAREKESLVPLTKSCPGYLKAPLGPARPRSGSISLISLSVKWAWEFIPSPRSTLSDSVNSASLADWWVSVTTEGRGRQKTVSCSQYLLGRATAPHIPDGKSLASPTGLGRMREGQPLVRTREERPCSSASVPSSQDEQRDGNVQSLCPSLPAPQSLGRAHCESLATWDPRDLYVQVPGQNFLPVTTPTINF